LKGEVRVELLLDDDRNFATDRAVVLASPSRELETVVERFRRQSGRCVVKLRGIDSIDDAEKVIGAEIRIPAGKLLPLDKGWFYTFELKGCRVFAGEEFIGLVTDVLDYGGSEILKVERDPEDGSKKEETLIPFAERFLRKIDLDGQRIDVELPEGLRGLNG
jgi:16S rRNA processing protein RimM